MKPYFQKLICDTETPVSLYAKLARDHKYAFLLESVEPHENLGRYSFIGFDPLHLEIFPAYGKEDPLEKLRAAYEKITYTPDSSLPRMQAGFVGYFAYEVARHFEKIVLPTKNAEVPEGIFFFPKNLLIFDHFEHTLTLIAYNEKDFKKLHKYFSLLLQKTGPTPIDLTAVSAPTPMHSNFDALVTASKEKICAGEIFQIVVSQLFKQKTVAPPFDLYRRLRIISPSPYMYYLQYPDFSIIGSSPETLVRTENDEIIVRPIAGTRRRGKTLEEDAVLEEELKNDIKEQAEHMMLVDLGRNDVGRVAMPGTVHVTRLAKVEKYSHVMHLVSEIRGKRLVQRPFDNKRASLPAWPVGRRLGLFDIFKMAFPAGTLTGAPKIRAMEIIAQLEKKPRGIYGGAVGYFDMTGNMDFAIAIRTMLYHNGEVSLRAGAGIVYDSQPKLENKECINKARGPLSALS